MIKIIAETTCTIPVDELQAMGVYVIPQIIIFGDESLRDDTEIDHPTFIARLKKSSDLPKTAAPPPALFSDIFKNEADTGNTLLIICPSSDLSGTVRSAETARAEFPDQDIRIIDTRNIGSGLGEQVRMAVSMANKGYPADEIIQKIMNMTAKQHLYFLVGTLEFLKKGGRIGSANALLGSILQVKPILTLVDGITGTFESQRTKSKALLRLKEIVTTNCKPGENHHITVMCGENMDEADKLSNEIKTELGLSEVRVYNFPPGIMVHAGPDVTAVSFFEL